MPERGPSPLQDHHHSPKPNDEQITQRDFLSAGARATMLPNFKDSKL